MSENNWQSLHFFIVEDCLPVGMAIFDRAREGGAEKVLEGLFSLEKPVEQLRCEGLSSASSVREKLDKIRPGLGNPAFEVEVDLGVNPNNKVDDSYNINDESLVNILERIDDRLSLLQSALDNVKTFDV